jgi:hypothetical protein
MKFDKDSFAGPRGFARHMLREGHILRPMYDQIMTYHHDGRSIMESILFRDGCWQIELVAAMPESSTPMHRHLRCASADLLLNGSVGGTVEGREFGAPRGRLEAQLKTIGKGEWHGGSAGPNGFIYLSFQQWDGEPTFISQDWEPWPTL